MLLYHVLLLQFHIHVIQRIAYADQSAHNIKHFDGIGSSDFDGFTAAFPSASRRTDPER
jgi:hypothetical protein